jgi:hypothetical protein
MLTTVDMLCVELLFSHQVFNYYACWTVCLHMSLVGWLSDWLFVIGETDVSEPRPSLTYCSSPGWMWVESCGHGDAGGVTPDMSTRARWQSYQRRHLKRVEGMDEGVRILHIQNLWYVNGFLHAVKSYDMGPPALLPIRRKETKWPCHLLLLVSRYRWCRGYHACVEPKVSEFKLCRGRWIFMGDKNP